MMPGQLLVRDDVALDEEPASRGVEAGREQHARSVHRLAPKLLGLDRPGQGVQIDDAVEGIGPILLRHPAAHGTQVVAEVQIARGLDSGEDARHEEQSYEIAADGSPDIVGGHSRDQ